MVSKSAEMFIGVHRTRHTGEKNVGVFSPDIRNGVQKCRNVFRVHRTRHTGEKNVGVFSPDIRNGVQKCRNVF